MKKRIGIYAVADYTKDLTKRMQLIEDARYKATHNLDEADEDVNSDKTPNQETGVEGGLDLDKKQDVQPKIDDTVSKMSDEDEEMLDLDALADDEDDTSQQQQADVEEEPTEEIDVTEFVEKGEELTRKVEQQVQVMSQQIMNLTHKLALMDKLLNKIQDIEDEIRSLKPPTPLETLKLRSLDSYPYNQGIDDYWKKKEIEIEKLRDYNRINNKQEYILTNDDVNNFSDAEIRKSFKPSNIES